MASKLSLKSRNPRKMFVPELGTGCADTFTGKWSAGGLDKKLLTQPRLC